ncbi:MAG TPA: glycogen synthase [Gammaproteobacteria bacterium]
MSDTFFGRAVKVLMVSAEYAPLAKAGGLADAVAGLAAALVKRGHDVRVLLPAYAPGLPTGWSRGAAAVANASVFVEASAGRPGPRVYQLDAPEIGAGGAVYAGDDRDAARFAKLCFAALDLPDAIGWRPDIVHCHDWHAALVPALLRTAEAPPSLAGARTVLTLHNVGYQGVFPESVLVQNGLGRLGALVADEDRADGAVVFLKIGIRAADRLTTVSPTYAREIRTPEHGMGLDALLRRRSADLVGILNGVDYGTWSPETDPFLEHHYGRAAPAGKALVKRALCARLALENDAPVVGAVSRLVEQKGIDLLIAAMPALLDSTAARFALLGSGDTPLEEALTALARRHPARVAFHRGYDEALAHLILAGSDLIVVPSRYEPCGLTQLYALRYGTIPVVRATGGLADTVVHFDPASGTGNGSVFEHADAQGLIWGLTTALGWHADAALRRRLIDNAMQADFSWDRQAPEYEKVYAELVGAAPPSDGGTARS